MPKRKPKHGYCRSCGKALKRPPAFEESCTIRCAADAWCILLGSSGINEMGYCRDCGEWREFCKCNWWEKEEEDV